MEKASDKEGEDWNGFTGKHVAQIMARNIIFFAEGINCCTECYCHVNKDLNVIQGVQNSILLMNNQLSVNQFAGNALIKNRQ